MLAKLFEKSGEKNFRENVFSLRPYVEASTLTDIIFSWSSLEEIVSVARSRIKIISDFKIVEESQKFEMRELLCQEKLSFQQARVKYPAAFCLSQS